MRSTYKERTPNTDQDCMEQWMNGSLDAYLASHADFAVADDIITILAKERAWDREHRTHSLIFDY